MRNVLFALLAMVCLCQAYANVCEPYPTIGIFKIICDLDAKQNNVEVANNLPHKTNPDSITATLLEKSREFYSESFSNILDVIIVFLTLIMMIITIAGIIVSVKYTRTEKFRNKTEDFAEKTNKELYNLKIETEETTKNIKDKLKDLDSLKKYTEEIIEKMKELEKAKKRDFLRMHHFMKIIMKKEDEETYNFIIKIEQEKEKEKIIPHLEEFYKRLMFPTYFEWWKKLNLNEKAKAFDDIVSQVDSDWGEEYVRNKE